MPNDLAIKPDAPASSHAPTIPEDVDVRIAVPSDAAALATFIDALSPDSLHRRFLYAVVPEAAREDSSTTTSASSR
jgi:hypothetical protein